MLGMITSDISFERSVSSHRLRIVMINFGTRSLKACRYFFSDRSVFNNVLIRPFKTDFTYNNM